MSDQNDLALTDRAGLRLVNLTALNNLPKGGESRSPVPHQYRFGRFVLDLRRRTLSRGDSPVVLTPKAFEVLSFLVRNPNRLVTKEELLESVWGDTFVEEGNLTQYISHLRKALGDNSQGSRLIVTIARKGYQFTGDVVSSHEAVPMKQSGGQVPVSERLPTDAAPGVPTRDVVGDTRKFWRNGVVAASAISLWRWRRPR